MTPPADWPQLIEPLLAAGDYTAAGELLAQAAGGELSQRQLARLVGAARQVAQQARDLWRPLHVRVLRTMTLESLAQPLTAAGLSRGLYLSTEFAPFGQIDQELLAPAADATPTPDVVLLATQLADVAPAITRRFLTLADADRRRLSDELLARCTQWMTLLRQRWPRALALVWGWLPPRPTALDLADDRAEPGVRRFVAELNDRLRTLCRHHAGIHFFDVAEAFAGLGLAHALDARLMAHARQPYSLAGLHALAQRTARMIAAAVTPRRKCLVLDADHTLWGGIVGEEGVDGIALGPDYPGSAFVALQDAALNLHDRGVVLALNSKNNPADVEEVWNRHPFQVLQREHFAAVRINWQDKATNLRELAAELNLGLESFVFLDDNPVECDFVRQQLPEVLVVQTPSDPLALADTIHSLEVFDALEVSGDDLRRNESYQAQSQQRQLQAASSTVEEYWQQLEMRLAIIATGPADVPRVAQLTQKTNQFNLTTRRYCETDIAALLAQPDAAVFHVQLADRFADYGTVGVAILRFEPPRLRIDTLLLSCRVLGRTVEQALMTGIVHLAHRRGLATVVGEFIPTAKNHPAQQYLADSRFTRLADTPTGQQWELPVVEPLGEFPPWFRLTVPNDMHAPGSTTDSCRLTD